MPARTRVPPDPPVEEQAAEPPFYEATQDIYVGDPESGFAPVAAFRTGSRVPPELVVEHGWGGMVKVPEQFKDVLVTPPAPPADETAAGNVAGEE